MTEIKVPTSIAYGQNDFSRIVAERAENLFLTRQMKCAQAVLTTINTAFGGGLSPSAVAGLCATFPEGIGGTGCLCGSMAGAQMAAGLILVERAGASPRLAEQEGAKILNGFKQAHASTCCRVLIAKAKKNNIPHFQNCARLTGSAAALCTDILLEHVSPVESGHDFLRKRESLFQGLLNRLLKRR